MTKTDTLSGIVNVSAKIDLANAISGILSGTDTYEHSVSKSITDGTGSNQSTGVCGGSVTATTGGVTLSLADSADPFGTGGNDVPSEDPEGKKLHLLVIENQDSTNYVTVGLGANPLAGFLAGTTPTARIDAGGFLVAYWPAGNSSAMHDGVDDEITVTANSASVILKIFYMFG